MTRIAALIAAAALALAPAVAAAQTFALSFAWGNIPLCTSGYPDRVDNPVFHLSGVPAGTVAIRFRLKDLEVPSYNHGGGTVDYRGQAVIQPGAFTYNSPCPPHQTHTYRWTAQALAADGSVLATTTAERPYPE